MAKKRAKRRSAPNTVPVPSNGTNVSVRQIKNGFLIERSGMKGRKYVSETEFSPGRPTISANVPAAPKANKPRAAAKHSGPVPLREVGFLNRSR